MISVIGGKGFIGSAIVRKLTQDGTEFDAPDRSESLRGRALGSVIYCAGLTADFRTRPIDTVEAHVCGLLEILRDCEFDRFVYLSSTRLYADDTREDAPISINPADPDHLYNATKVAGEAMVLTVAGERGIVARLSNVYGPGMSASFLSSVVSEATAGHITLQEHPDSEKDYIAVDDVADALSALATSNESGIFNVASGRNVTHRQIAERLALASGCLVEFGLEGLVRRMPQIDIGKLAVLGPTPSTALLDELEMLVEMTHRPADQ